MNCATCQDELEDFLYGELDDARANAVRTHLRACASCAQLQAELEREQEIFAQYYEQAAQEPSSEMWQAIQVRIRENQAPAPIVSAEPAQTWWQRLFGETLWLQQGLAAAALVIVSVTATALYFKWQNSPATEKMVVVTQTPTPVLSPSPEPKQTQPAGDTKTVTTEKVAPPKAQTASLPMTPKKLSDEQLIQNQMARAEREYQQAIKLLDRVIARKRNELDPALWQQYTASLALIDKSIAESRTAMKGDANAAASGQFLLAAYAKKLDLMRDIAMQAGQ